MSACFKKGKKWVFSVLGVSGIGYIIEEIMEDVRRRHDLLTLQHGLHMVTTHPNASTMAAQSQAERPEHSEHSEHPQQGEEDPEDDAVLRAASAATSAGNQEAGMEMFRQDVHAWLDIESSIKNLQAMLRDRRAHKKVLCDRIVRYMHQYGIEDLHTREGRISSRTSYVQAPLSHRTIKEKIGTFFSDNTPMVSQLLRAVFTRERVEKQSLRRSAMQS